MDRQLLNVREFAEAVGIGETLAKRLIREGSIISVRIADRRLIPVQAVRDYVERLVTDAQRQSSPA